MAESARLELAGASDESEAEPKPKTKPKKRFAWRSWLRAIHRDVGYLLVGLTVVYALSGLAVNHVDDWNANFEVYERRHRIEQVLPKDDDQRAAAIVISQLGIDEPADDVYRLDESELEVSFEHRTLLIDLDEGVVQEHGQKPRFLLRAANWLHLNRGKKAWTYIADSYAVLLLFLALSGMFMLRGRKGLVGRGAILVTLGAAVPILYVTLSGGP